LPLGCHLKIQWRRFRTTWAQSMAVGLHWDRNRANVLRSVRTWSLDSVQSCRPDWVPKVPRSAFWPNVKRKIAIVITNEMFWETTLINCSINAVLAHRPILNLPQRHAWAL
jgi:hypothetical protein